jgi:hypothetical protein
MSLTMPNRTPSAQNSVKSLLITPLNRFHRPSQRLRRSRETANWVQRHAGSTQFNPIQLNSTMSSTSNGLPHDSLDIGLHLC